MATREQTQVNRQVKVVMRGLMASSKKTGLEAITGMVTVDPISTNTQSRHLWRSRIVRLLNHEKIRRGYDWMGREGGKLDGPACTAAVRIVEKCTGGTVVEDEIIGISGCSGS